MQKIGLRALKNRLGHYVRRGGRDTRSRSPIGARSPWGGQRSEALPAHAEAPQAWRAPASARRGAGRALKLYAESSAILGWLLGEERGEGVRQALVERARSPFPGEPLRTLDALHLAPVLVAATALGDLTLLSVDERIRTAGRALGFRVVPA